MKVSDRKIEQLEGSLALYIGMLRTSETCKTEHCIQFSFSRKDSKY